MRPLLTQLLAIPPALLLEAAGDRRLAAAAAGGVSDGPVAWLLEGSQHPPSVYIVLSLGVFLGNVAMGVTGFGTAILHLSCWATANAFGVYAGSLKLAVISCSCAMTVGMIPLVFLADARQHAIRPLALSIPLAKAVGAPMGALLLKLVPPRPLEGLVAALMLVMMAIINRRQLRAVGFRSWAALRGGRADAWAYEGGGMACAPGGCGGDGDDAGSKDGDELVPLVAAQRHRSDGVSGGSGGSGGGGGAGEQYGQQACLAAARDGAAAVDAEGSAGVVPPAAGPHATVGVGAQSSTAGAPQATQSVASGPSTEYAGRFWTLFAAGTAAGFSSGLLGGATGVNGPPLMVLYSWLGAAKEAVRGTSAVVALVQDQWVGYWALGLLSWADAPVYLAASAAGGLGMAAGHAAQRLMDQRQFSAVMTALMVLCFVLMTSSAAGWIQLVDAGGAA
ncbi:hypothetical protein MNEG_3036 [Monoraphidium neglectum]|uniref:Uncharacterized protein n=1 Tax=Monoraphidium neglectum TaxID=145388 RepID=A0A0D2MQH7_9CHLO|nr:hypothetical protein MNEG_3036 [Monoraphidium neglectum]KIZ04920.1 hypothetical protein MNEG_3036 [Monoraphidium neglectum]|eukprot:XP_013903939.1 hypothetical protein MNEG_3036 [Monoraphidium neglectum]